VEEGSDHAGLARSVLAVLVDTIRETTRDDFIGGVRERSYGRRIFTPPGGPERSLEDDVLIFGSTIRLYAEHERRMPCFIEAAQPAFPIDPLIPANDLDLRLDPSDLLAFPERYRDDLHAMGRRSGFYYDELPTDVVLYALQARLTSFLQPLAAAGMGPPTGAAKTYYLAFDVHTKTPGLRVYLTKQYKFSPGVLWRADDTSLGQDSTWDVDFRS
jgi:hypothetical protein